MSAGQGFDLHPDAAQDITEIWGYLAEDSPIAAGRVREEIMAGLRRLAPFPHQGPSRSDLITRPLRFQTVRDYLIAIMPDEKPLVVIAVLHGRRNPRVIAGILQGRV